MVDGSTPRNSYERKLKLIIDASLARYHGVHTEEQYQLELSTARNILTLLGVSE